MTFNTFQQQVTAAGFEARKCTETHWQIRGGVKLVNFYPSSSTIHIDGTKGSSCGPVAAAILAAQLGHMPDGSVQKRPDRHRSRVSNRDRIEVALSLADDDMPDGAFFQMAADIAGVEVDELAEHLMDEDEFDDDKEPGPRRQRLTAKPHGVSAAGQLRRQIKEAGEAGVGDDEANLPWVPEFTHKHVFRSLERRGLIEQRKGRWYAKAVKP